MARWCRRAGPDVDRRQLPPRLRQSRPRAADAGRAPGGAPRGPRLDLLRGVAGVPRVRADDDHAGGRLRQGARRRLRGVDPGPPGRRARRRHAVLRDEVERRGDLRARGGAPSHHDDPERAGRRRPRRGVPGRRRRLRPHPDHGRRRDQHRRVPGRARRAGAHGRRRRRAVPRQGADDRPGHRRHRRRLDRRTRAGRRPPGGAGQRGGRSRPDVLRPRRDTPDGDRRPARAGPHPRAPPRWRGPPGARSRPEGDRDARRRAGAEPGAGGRGHPGDRGLEPGERHPADERQARAGPAGLHAGRLRRLRPAAGRASRRPAGAARRADPGLAGHRVGVRPPRGGPQERLRADVRPAPRPARPRARRVSTWRGSSRAPARRSSARGSRTRRGGSSAWPTSATSARPGK